MNAKDYSGEIRCDGEVIAYRQERGQTHVRPRMIMFKSQALRLIIPVVLLGGAGCGLTHDRIVIGYTPMHGVERAQAAGAVGIKVQAVDVRTNKKEVARKRWENRPDIDFGGDIIAQDDLADVIGEAIESELSSRGFRQKDGSLVVVSELRKCYAEFKGFPEKAVAEVILNVQVKKPDGEIVFDKEVTGQGVRLLTVVAANFSGELRSGTSAKAVLDFALSDAISKLFRDTAFIRAILQAGAGPRTGMMQPKGLGQ